MRNRVLLLIRITPIVFVSILLLIPLLALNVQAAPGDLDTSFSSDGKVTTDFGSDDDRATDIAIQADGKIVVVGRSSIGDFLLARYNSTGTLDTTFSGDGQLTTNIGAIDEASAIAIQADGKIVVAGTSFANQSGDFALARYNSNGTLDTTFSGDGKLTTDFGFNDGGRAIAIQADGKIVVAGASPAAFALARYNSNGTLDTTFSGDGLVVTHFALCGTTPPAGCVGLEGPGSANDIAIQNDGKIVVAGTMSEFIALARYNSDGTLDTNFGGEDGLGGGHGRVLTRFTNLEPSAEAIAIQSDGKIVVAGDSTTLTTPFFDTDFVLTRYHSDGTLDTSFGGGDGFVTTNIFLDDFVSDMVIQPDGKFVVAGSAGFPAIARYNSNGTLDITFGGGDGFIIGDNIEAISIQKNAGRIVAAGGTAEFGPDTDFDFSIARYHAYDCNGFDVTKIGTQGNDSISGDFIINRSGTIEFNDVINGLAGNDTIDGRGGNDIICGGTGDDTIKGGDGNDTLFGNSGSDNIDGGNGKDACQGGGLRSDVDTITNCERTATSNSGLSGVWVGDVRQTCENTETDLICKIEGTLEVTNPGTETVAATDLKFFLSFDENFDEEDTLIEETQVNSLDPQGVQEVSLLAELPPGDDAIGEFVIALLDAEGEVAEVNEENNEVVSSAIVGEGSEGGNVGCGTLAGSIPAGASITNVLVLVIPVFVIGFRVLVKRRNRN